MLWSPGELGDRAIGVVRVVGDVAQDAKEWRKSRLVRHLRKFDLKKVQGTAVVRDTVEFKVLILIDETVPVFFYDARAWKLKTNTTLILFRRDEVFRFHAYAGAYVAFLGFEVHERSELSAFAYAHHH